MVVLRSPVALAGRDLTHVGEFTVAAGEMVPFVLTYGPSHLPLPTALDGIGRVVGDRSVLERMGRQVPAGGPLVGRSRALGDDAQGSDLCADRRHRGGADHLAARAAGRRAQLGLSLLLAARRYLHAARHHEAGYYEEAQAWRDWLVRAVAGSPQQTQIIYGLAGERRTTEWEVPWLPGYEGSAPVRIGNRAHEQLQLDVYGEVMDAFYQARRGGLPLSEPPPRCSSPFWSISKRCGANPTRASGRCAAGGATSPIPS